MQTAPHSFELAQATRQTRRVWHGNGCSRIVQPWSDDCNQNQSFAKTDLSATAVDEALSDFEPLPNQLAADATSITEAWRQNKDSLVAQLAKQLSALDRQREQLASLLREVK